MFVAVAKDNARLRGHKLSARPNNLKFRKNYKKKQKKSNFVFFGILGFFFIIHRLMRQTKKTRRSGIFYWQISAKTKPLSSFGERKALHFIISNHCQPCQ
jgi:hypothetical protein